MHQRPSPVVKFSFATILRQHSSLIIFLITCLLATIAFEIYRGRLLSGINGQHHIWGWYFGLPSLRFSQDFWRTLAERFNLWVPPYFLYAYVAISVFSISQRRRTENLAVVISALFAFFSGWLVFSNVYMIHDYYQMPVAIIMFISVSVSVSQLIETHLTANYLAEKMESVIPVLVLVLFVYQLANQNSFSVKNRADFWKAAEYSLRKDDVFLFVSDKDNNPAIGGRVSTKFIGISPREFEENCDEYLQKYSSVLVENTESKCLESAKKSATHYFADEGMVFMRTRPVNRGGDS